VKDNSRVLEQRPKRSPGSRAFLLGAAIVVAALVVFGWLVYVDSQSVVGEARWVDHTLEVLLHLERAASALKDSESGQRGYLLTGNTSYLRPYDAAISQVRENLDALRRLTLNNAEQQHQVSEFEGLAQQKLEELAATIRLYQSGDTAGALRAVESGAGNTVMERIRGRVDAMRDAEKRLLAVRQRQAAAAVQEMNRAIVAGMLVFIGLLAAFLALVRRDLLGRARAEAEARETGERFRTTLASIGDAVLTADSDGCVRFLNPVAERLTGWPSSDATGRRVEQVFDILNEKTREPVESPVRRVIRDGVVVGLANHTVLRTRDGREVPIADSGAPIRDAGGGVTGVVLVFRDVSVLRRAEVATRRLAAIVSSATFALVAETPDNVITDWNPGAEALFGYTAAEMIGRKFFELAQPDSDDPAPTLTDELREGRPAGEFEGFRRTKDGRWLEVVVTLSAIRDEDGRLIGIARLIRDVTERRRQGRELEHARHRAEEASETKDRFLATLSHELRNPLTPVLASIHRLDQRSDLPEGITESLAMIRRNVELEARLIDDLLDLTRIAKGKIDLDKTPIDLHELLGSVLQSSRSDFFQHGLNVTTALVAEDHYCLCDAGRLQQVFLNLTRNAAKFTPPGGRITIRSNNPAPRRIRIEIADTGRGIRADRLPHIFEAFDQGDVTAARRAGGLGLGLAISRNLVELHGGTILAASEGEGRGATFSVEFATTAERPKRATPEARDDEGRSIRRRLAVLIVEDDPDTGTALRLLLDEAGFDARAAQSVASALEAFRDRPADVLVTDVGLPDGSGLDLLAALKPLQPRLAAIVLSGFGMERDIERSRALGFVEHFAKPVNPSRLIAALDALGRTVSSAPEPAAG
jgi:two-component system CheB/CheR fusion protein